MPKKATANGILPNIQPLLDLGFAPLTPDETTHNPLRLYLVMPMRDEAGVWYSVPVMSAPLPIDCQAVRELAETLGAQRKRRRFDDKRT